MRRSVLSASSIYSYICKLNCYAQSAAKVLKMAIRITEECINCGACEPECPNNAIYEGGAEWRFSDGTGVKGLFKGFNSGVEVDADSPQPPVSMDLYYIVSDKC